MSGAYRQLAVAVSIGEPHTYGVTADAGAGVHPQCLVAECCSLGGRRSRRPGADPMQIIRHISSSSDGRAGYRTTTSMSQPPTITTPPERSWNLLVTRGAGAR